MSACRFGYAHDPFQDVIDESPLRHFPVDGARERDGSIHRDTAFFNEHHTVGQNDSLFDIVRNQDGRELRRHSDSINCRISMRVNASSAPKGSSSAIILAGWRALLLRRLVVSGRRTVPMAIHWPVHSVQPALKRLRLYDGLLFEVRSLHYR